MTLFKEGKFSDIQRYLKSITKSNTIPTGIFLDQRTANTDIEKVILFNEHFQSVFTQNTYYTKIREKNSTLLNQIHFTTDEIENVLQILDVNKAKGPDKIGNLLHCRNHCTYCLTSSQIKPHFPEKWKISETAPIFKDEDKQDVSNYRPISLLSTVSKLLEKLIFEKLTPIVYPTLASSQHGFRPKRSPITNLIEYLHEIYSCLESENFSYLNIFYIDFEKAFDKVTHELLIQKLAALGIGGNCLNLLRSYLYKRKQTVRLNDTVSDELEVFSGVPQGSILGPLFFLVFINDLPSCVMSKSFSYADDYKIVGDNPLTLNINVRKLWRWCDENFMSMNLGKSKVLCIKGTALIALPNHEFETTECMKDLGILVNDTLSWTLHAKKRTEKALNALFILKRNLSKATFWTRKNAYICYVVPILNYGSALWKTSKGYLGTLESIQRKAVSWIFITNNISYKDKLVKLDILPISLYQKLHVILLFAKILTGKVDIDWRSQVTITDIGTRRTQAKRNFAC